jgi:hypothetical protein
VEEEKATGRHRTCFHSVRVAGRPFMLYVTYQLLALLFYGINNLSWAIMLFFWILGALLYPIGKWYYGKKGLNLSLVFKELPPECSD